MKADKVLTSKAIYNGLEEKPINGCIALKGNKIIAVESTDGTDYIDSHTEIFDLGNRLVCPGFTDVHCFFTGYLLTISGADLSECKSSQEVITALKKLQNTQKEGTTLLAREVNAAFSQLTREYLDKTFGTQPVILIHTGNESCFMNTAAVREYQFTPDSFYPESYWRLLKYILNEISISVPAFKKYLNFMNSKGITSIKEMGFDNFYGFTDELEKMEKSNELTVRVSFMSQPVSGPVNLKFGQEMRKKFTGGFVHFSGYNQMTDGSISQLEGEMKEPYLCKNTCCTKAIDWKSLEQETLAADKENFRFSLHAQGDLAIEKAVNIFGKCQKINNGKLKNRHAITDLEYSDPKDLERMGQLGIIAEIYPQIMSIANRIDKIAMIEEKIGIKREKNYWNRRKMADNGIIISCGTDLPLLFDDIPESIYHSVGARFPEGGEPFLPENVLKISELLKAWSYGGQYNLGFEDSLGTLEAGKLADITVFNRNLFETPLKEIRDVSICLTLVDGQIVYQA